MQRNPISAIIFGTFIAALFLGMTAGIVLERQVFDRLALNIPVTGQPSEETVDMGLIQEAWNTINRIYVDRDAVKGRELTYGAISGMVDALGDTGHSRFLTPEMVAEENSFTEGQFEGIGIEVQMQDGQLTVVAPLDGSPAQDAGLEPGDVIQKVNGEEITGQPLEEIVGKIKGPAGTSVDLTVLKADSGNAQDLTLERKRIPLDNVNWNPVPGTTVAYVRISAFTRGIGDELKQALKDAKDQGMQSVVLDLRNNPGGLLQEAVAVASQFLADGYVMQEKNASGRVTPVEVVPGGEGTSLPLVVLINQGSASASEIVAGALQDANRARLVGETTFGTGTVLNQFNLSDGSALLLATEEWLTPEGRVIWHKGIDPDEPVALEEGAFPINPYSLSSMRPEEVASSGDAQLIKALEMLDQPVTQRFEVLQAPA
ncbi:MAG TPA: S41 family peptidase [Anaerolineaceae bacterium]